MKVKSISILTRLAAVSAISAVALSFSSGCKSATKGNPTVPPPSNQPAAAQPLSSQPAITQPATLVEQPANTAPVTSPAIPDVKGKAGTYSVQKGDTFSKIAKKYGVGMKELATYTNLSLQKPLQIGTTLKIPQK